MTSMKMPVTLIVAEDDDDDFFLMERAFRKLKLKNDIHRVRNGKELMDYFEDKYSGDNHNLHHQPHLILLDLNMPIMDGRSALEALKKNPITRNIVVVVLTTSDAEEYKVSSYQLGVNSYIRKPMKQDDFIQALNILKQYWLELVDLPE